jgi:uncharacterized membrane protein
MNLSEIKVLFIIITAVVALIVASPVLSRILVYPRTEFFSEMWLLGPNHKAEGYPYNVTQGHNYNVFLGVGNHLGYCAYYVVQLKFRNETQSMPTRFGPVEDRTPSSMPSLFNISTFLADEQNWELPISFSFDYESNLNGSKVEFKSLTFNDEFLDLEGYVTAWNGTKNFFFGDLIFELWIYDTQATSLSYHGLFVDLKFNMTTPDILESVS